MSDAFTFGKYLPFHRGHEALIRFGLGQCARLTVLVCASDRETLLGARRRAWIEETLADAVGAGRLTVRVLDYREAELPNTSVASAAVSRRWAERFAEAVPAAGLVVTSEPYGALVAAAMEIAHLDFDLARARVPVSGTTVREDVFGAWPYLPPAVRRDLVTKVVVLGTESTGKSTLCAALAEHFDATLVEEAGRELIPDSRAFTLADLAAVARVHAERVAAASVGDRPLVIVDTDVHVTMSYARFSLGEELVVGAGAFAAQRADLYLLPPVRRALRARRHAPGPGGARRARRVAPGGVAGARRGHRGGGRGLVGAMGAGRRRGRPAAGRAPAVAVAVV